jgi:uncharacterized protein YbjQ (UPF0145 family)
MKYFALSLLIATMGMTATLGNSTMSYKEMSAACPGALGAVTFASHHARFQAGEGMTENVGSADANGVVKASFTNPKTGASAKVSADQTKSTVSAKHMKLESHGHVACISAD